MMHPTLAAIMVTLGFGLALSRVQPTASTPPSTAPATPTGMLLGTTTGGGTTLKTVVYVPRD